MLVEHGAEGIWGGIDESLERWIGAKPERKAQVLGDLHAGRFDLRRCTQQAFYIVDGEGEHPVVGASEDQLLHLHVVAHPFKQTSLLPERSGQIGQHLVNVTGRGH